MRTFYKPVTAGLDWLFDWSQWLSPGETLTASSVTVDDGLTLVSSAFNGTSVTVWLSGGIAGQRYEVTSQVTTSASRSDEKSFQIQVTG